MSNPEPLNMKILQEAAAWLAKQWPQAKPAAGMILGSGWGEVVRDFTIRDSIDYEKIPGLGRTGVPGHTGRLYWAELAGLNTFIFQGRRHWYEGIGFTPIALPVYLLKAMRARMVLVTNAAGGIREDLKPGMLMLIDDHINAMGVHPLIGPHESYWGARFPDQTRVYDTHLRNALKKAAEVVGEKLAHGIYLAASGPTYETPAEIRMYRTWGADAVGMSTVPEATLAHAARLRVVGLSCITNCAAGLAAGALSHEEVTDATKHAMPRMKALIAQFWQELSHERT